MNRAAKAALVVVGIAVAAAPFWVALTIPLEKFETPRTSAAPASVLTDLARWDAATAASRRAAAEDVARRLPDFALLRMETFSCGGQTHEVAIYSHAKTGMEFVLVPVGTFVMGAPVGEAGRDEAEKQHTVTLTRPFLICRTECTQAAWSAVSGEPSRARFAGAQRPMESISWDAASDFCARAALALPSEAQWEWACRAGTTSAFAFGDVGAATDYAWCGEPLFGMSDASVSHPVAQKRPNAFGLFDTLGNVAEWCGDWYAAPPSEPSADPSGPPGGTYRVVRGEGWLQTAEQLRSARRNFYAPNLQLVIVGFRPAKTVPME